MDVLNESNIFEVTMTARSLAACGLSVREAVDRASSAHRDPTCAELLIERRAELRALDGASIRRRARAVRLAPCADPTEFLARVEVERELRTGFISALGPVPMEHP